MIVLKTTLACLLKFLIQIRLPEQNAETYTTYAIHPHHYNKLVKSKATDIILLHKKYKVTLTESNPPALSQASIVQSGKNFVCDFSGLVYNYIILANC